jgi:perosamine synthetase
MAGGSKTGRNAGEERAVASIKQTRIPVARPALGEREIGYLEDCIYSGRIASDGAFVEMFEERFRAWCGAGHAIATTNGTAALHLALVALGVGRGDEVIIPSMAYIAAANAVSYTGARPVIVDVNRESWTIDPGAVADAVSPRTKGIVAVHLYGHPADFDPIRSLAERFNLFLLESASDALGASYRGERVGLLGNAACFSFGPSRTLTTGGGGMLVTENEDLAVKARYLAMQGRVSRREFLHSWIGFDYRMTNLQAALGAAQMDEIDLRIGIRRDIGIRYRELLAGIPGLRVGAEVPWAVPSFGRVALLVEEPFPCPKGELQAVLRKEGIETEPFYYPIHLQVPYMRKARPKRLPVAESLYERGILLPTSTFFAPEELVEIAGAIRRACATRSEPASRGRRRKARKEPR